VLDGYGVQSSCASSIEWCGPLLVSGGFNWASVSAGEFHTCGVTTGGEGYCWGYGSDYQLGEIGGRGPHLNPNPVNGSHTWKTISAGNHHSCGVTTADDAYCWGNNDYGQLGDGNLAERPEIIPVSGGRAWASIDVGYDHTCGVTTGGEGYCWGKNHGGQLGHGSTSTSPTTQPGVVIGGFTWASITAGEAHTCGVTTVGGAYCWGHDTYGQLGDGPGRNAGFSPLLVKVGGNW
jgi:alpha-tubulin suppressor-like RCC1 family protein